MDDTQSTAPQPGGFVGLRDRVAIVTGGAGAVGMAVSSSLAAAGAKVASFDLVAAPQATLGLSVDVTNPDVVASATRTVVSELGVPSLLVCAAGVVSAERIVDLSPEEWHRVVDVSLTGSFLAMRAVIPHLVDRGRGSVVAFSSGYARKGSAGGAHYAAAKAGVEALVKSAALEHAADGVRVNAIAPGPIATPFVAQVADDLGAWRQERGRHVPIGRVAEAGDLVGPVLFLLSEASAHVTGQVLHVNGGLLMP